MTTELQQRFAKSPDLFAHMLDIHNDQVLLSQLSEADYHKASFLDQRIVTPELRRQFVPWDSLSGLQMPANPAPTYIFHIGHVGSTLISRLLGELPGVLAVREPQVLRDLYGISQVKDEAHSPWSPDMYETRLNQIASWLSRTFNPGQRAVIKASSFVSEMAGELIGDDNKSLFLYVPLERYMETILAGENSQKEVVHMAGQRLARLNNRLKARLVNLWELSLFQKIALSWLCEMTALYEVSQTRNEGHIVWQDFGTFLENPAEDLLEITQHFKLACDLGNAQALVSGPIMRSYSKAPEHDYSPDLRRDLLREAQANYGNDIHDAMTWATELAKTYPLIEKVITFAEKGR